jgi:(E)-4-hydroxy-3-methylbut-2-enyl-diphosphate synthase
VCSSDLGTFEDPVAPVFVDGKLHATFRGDDIVARFVDLLESYVEQRYPMPGEAGERIPTGA